MLLIVGVSAFWQASNECRHDGRAKPGHGV
jgi:hypothetical protein